MRNKNNWPGSLRESVADSTGDKHYLDDATLDFFDSHMVKMLTNTGTRFVVVEKVTREDNVDWYQGTQFHFTFDALGAERHVTVSTTDKYRTIEQVEEVVLDRDFFND